MCGAIFCRNGECCTTCCGSSLSDSSYCCITILSGSSYCRSSTTVRQFVVINVLSRNNIDSIAINSQGSQFNICRSNSLADGYIVNTGLAVFIGQSYYILYAKLPSISYSGIMCSIPSGIIGNPINSHRTESSISSRERNLNSHMIRVIRSSFNTCYRYLIQDRSTRAIDCHWSRIRVHTTTRSRSTIEIQRRCVSRNARNSQIIRMLSGNTARHLSN